MNIPAALSFLGTGGSMGVPLIGCHCPVCSSDNPHNHRLRPSALLTYERNKRILIDCGPDFRLQAMRAGLESLDAVILTHTHYDHTAGIDELRIYNARQKKTLPCLLSQATHNDLCTRYGYIFVGDARTKGLVTQFDLTLLPNERGTISFQGLNIGYTTFDQAGMEVNGFRFGELAYMSDIKTYPETIFEDLKGVKHLVISALRFTHSHLHFSVDEALAFAERSGAQHTWLTHIAHEIDHEKANAYLPQNVRLAYDGLKIPFIAERSSTYV